jgi:hypothetical protein
LLGNHFANFIFAGPLLWNHFADLVLAGPGFRNHLADFVAAGLGPLLWNHFANFIFAGPLLWNHFADLVLAGLGPLFANHLGAADFFFDALRHPNPLAADLRWGLASQRLAWTRLVDTAALAWIPYQASRLTHGLGADLARDLILLSFPMASLDLDGLGVLHRHADGVVHFSLTSFPNRLADGVAPRLGFPDWLADGVANFLLTCFPNRLADGVGALTSFPNRLADGVAPRLGFPDRLADGVANFLLTCFPDRLANSVGSSLGFPDWFADGVANFFLTLFRNHACDIDDFVKADPVVDCSITGYFLLLMLHASNRLHHGMTPLLMARWRTSVVVPCRTAVSG